MKTTATNRKVRTLLTAINKSSLIPRPDFQRRLVWTTKDKQHFLDTVLNGYPFPEIYIAAGEVDLDTGEGTELLVDGQQRITTLFQYFTASAELKLGNKINPYAELSAEEKESFLEYDVVVRDLGHVDIEEIKEVFQRINATRYSLNDMEIHNSRYAGEFKKFAEAISQNGFFTNHHIFSVNEIRRMSDMNFIVTFIITIMSTYFHRDEEIEDYLSTYNDEFPNKEAIGKEIEEVLAFIDKCNFGNKSRVWKKTDLLTLLVEIHRAIIKENLPIKHEKFKKRVEDFYQKVNTADTPVLGIIANRDILDYAKAASQATNDRSSRMKRGDIIYQVILQSLEN